MACLFLLTDSLASDASIENFTLLRGCCLKDCEANRSLKPFSIIAFSNTLQRYFDVSVNCIMKKSFRGTLQRRDVRDGCSRHRVNRYIHVADVLQIQDVDEAMALSDKGVAMPFFVNNVDVTVAANTVNGLTSALLSGLFKPSDFDSDIQV